MTSSRKKWGRGDEVRPTLIMQSWRKEPSVIMQPAALRVPEPNTARTSASPKAFSEVRGSSSPSIAALHGAPTVLSFGMLCRRPAQGMCE